MIVLSLLPQKNAINILASELCFGVAYLLWLKWRDSFVVTFFFLASLTRNTIQETEFD